MVRLCQQILTYVHRTAKHRVKVGLHLAKLGRLKNLVDFPPQNTPLWGAPEIRSQHQFVRVAEVS